MTDADQRNWNEIIVKLRSRTSHQVFNERVAVEMERMLKMISNADQERYAPLRALNDPTTDTDGLLRDAGGARPRAAPDRAGL